MKLTDLLANNRALTQWQRGLNQNSRTLFTGIQGTIKTLLMATAFDNQPDKYVIITDNQYHAGADRTGLHRCFRHGDTTRSRRDAPKGGWHGHI